MSSELTALIDKMINRIDELVPNITDSEEILLISKTVQELYDISTDFSDVDFLKEEIKRLNGRVNSLTADVGVNNILINENKNGILANDNRITSLTTDIDNHYSAWNPHQIDRGTVTLWNVRNFLPSSDPEDRETDLYATARSVNLTWRLAKSNVIPAGTIMAFSGTTSPDGWLWLKGQNIKVGKHLNLDDHVKKECPHWMNSKGDKYTLPDSRGMFIRGYDPEGKIDPDGSKRLMGRKQSEQIKKHSHTGGFPEGTVWLDKKYDSDGGYPTEKNPGSFKSRKTGNVGGPENRPININLLWMIKT